MSIKIITHPGSAHRDEFMACCLLIAEHRNVIIFRREPTPEELADPDIYVVDIGGCYSPSLRNFDHHQLPREHSPICSLSMVMKDMGIYDDACLVLPWLKATEILDSKGPFALAAYIGCPPDNLIELISPVESQILQQFQRFESLGIGDHIYSVMSYIGEGVLSYLRKVVHRLQLLEQSKVYTIAGVNIIDTRHLVNGCDDPAMGLEIYCKKRLYDNVGITVTNDDRGSGITLFRRNDDPRVDFSRIKEDGHCIFAHANGFIAKLQADSPVESFIAKSLVSPIQEESDD